MKKFLPILFGLLSLHFAVSQTIQLDIKVYLEGPFSTGQMTTDLNSSGFLPLNQPFGSAPWNYGGIETVSSIPNADIVDWVLIDVVSVTFTDDTAKLLLLGRKACFLLKNGQVRDLDGVSLPTFPYNGQTPFHVRIHHRNHLNVISASALTEDLGLYSWDFTTGSEKALGDMHTQKQIGTGIWGMISSNGNAGGQVNNVDKNEVWLPELGLSGYLFGDYNMNGQVDMNDKLTQWKLNVGRGSYPVRDSIVVPPFALCGDAITDIDGNVYGTVLIGDQCWMKENLKTTTYRNGTLIPNVTNNSAWWNLTTGAYVWYANDINWKDKYGALYNWFTVVDTNGLCPTGWHVPSLDDWIVLSDFIGGTASPNGNKLKSCRQVNSPLGGGCNTSEHPRWDQHSTHYGTDDYGFSGLPGGVRFYSGDFYQLGVTGGWHASTEYSMNYGRFCYLWYNDGNFYMYYQDKQIGRSVRCIRVPFPAAAFIAEPTSGTVPLTVNFTDLSTNNPVSWLWNFGDGNASAQQNPAHTYQNPGSYTVQLTVTNSYGSDTEIKSAYILVSILPEAAFTGDPTNGLAPLTVNFTDLSTNNPTTWLWDFGDGNTSTQQNPAHTYQNAGFYTVQLTVTNTYGSDTEFKTNYITVTGGSFMCGSSTVTDIDGNIYNTVLIGDQCWMKENLKTTTYKNGTPIPNITNSSNWTSLTTGAYVWYENDINWKDKYGGLYNWYAVVDPIGLCPEGWHVPSHIEWTALTTFIGGASSPNGNKLKSCRMVNSPLGGDCNTSEHPRWNQGFLATDDYGFSGLPGGLRNETGLFYPIGYYGHWWTTTAYSSTESYFRELGWDHGSVGVWYFHKRGGLSVRCLKDD